MKKYLIVLSLLLLSACSFKELPPLKRYTLWVESRTAPVFSSRYHTKIVKVAFPQMLKERMSHKMYYSYSDRETGVYQNAQWSNTIGKLLQGNFIQILDQSRLFKAVLPYTSTAGEDLRLESSIFDFSHHVRGDDSYAVVSIEFSLINTDTGRLIKTKRFNYKEETSTTDAKGYVEATHRAMGRLSRDLVGWLR